MAARAGLFLLLTFAAIPCARETRAQWVVWNVGQGLWTTLAREGECWHFDLGGEHAPWPAIEALCRSQMNRAHFSHWDWDHIGFASQAAYRLPQFCRLNRPAGPSSPRKQRLMDRIESCAEKPPYVEWDAPSAEATNARSAVIAWSSFVVPGDSPKGAERLWSAALPIAETHVLVLGHHGSRTATSLGLLQKMPNLRMAVASARERRYGHPHRETALILRKFRVPLLRTEDWGNLHFWQ